MAFSRFYLSFMCFVLLLSVQETEATTSDDWVYFFKNIFNVYDKKVYPRLDQSDILEVNISYSLNAITNFDEVGGVLLTVGYLRVEWYNELLTWTEKQKDTSDVITSTMVALSEIWHPPITLANSVTSLAELGAKKDNVEIRYDGRQVWKPPVILSSGCSSDPTNFPFDTQKCNLTFQSWDFAGEEVLLRTSDTQMNLDSYNENEMWKLEKTEVDSYTDASHSYVTYTLTLKRIPMWFIINIVAPLSLLGFLNAFVFLTPIEEGRLGYALAAFLTFSVFLTMIGDHLPSTADPMSTLSFYVVIEVMMSGLTAFFSVFSIRLYVKTDDESIPKVLACFVSCICCAICERKAAPKKKVKKVTTVFDSILDQADDDDDDVYSAPRLGVANSKWTPVDDGPDSDGKSRFCCFVIPETDWAQVSTAMDYAFFVTSLVTNIVLGFAFLLPIYQQY